MTNRQDQIDNIAKYLRSLQWEGSLLVTNPDITWEAIAGFLVDSGVGDKDRFETYTRFTDEYGQALKTTIKPIEYKEDHGSKSS